LAKRGDQPLGRYDLVEHGPSNHRRSTRQRGPRDRRNRAADHGCARSDWPHSH
jgi:hypothetical protein